LSRRNFPKQFVPLVDGQSLLDLTFKRVQEFGTPALVVSGEEHRFLVVDTMQRARASGDVILESVGRNTAPAMALAALQVNRDDGLLLFCPADHHIPDAKAFAQVVRSGMLAAQAGAIVIFGIQPSYPATGYGYIQQGVPLSMGDARSVRRFIEKPDRQTAEHLLLDACVFWNAGIFLCRRDVLLDALAQHAPDILDTCRVAMAAAQEESPLGNVRLVRPDAQIFGGCRSQSIDQAVIEKHRQVAVVPFSGRWSDVGSWNAVAELTSADADGNRIEGQGIAHRARGTYIQAPTRTVVALGTQDLLIVDTADVVLVANRSYAEEVKEVVAKLDEFRRTETITHRKVARPWGWYDSIDLGERFQVKKITVKPGSALSLQMHHHRAEHWIVVRGTAEVTRGTDTFLLTENQSTYIPLGESHRLRNPGKVELELIEVQSGSYLGEDDIVRFEDTYGRGQLAGVQSRVV
jgi:mannose-1-phosphate guanylyltransferase/mannose-6-phosphate isomerase